jgi:hypothetical protein
MLKMLSKFDNLNKKYSYFYIITCFSYRDRLNRKLLSLFTGSMGYLINAMKSYFVLLNYGAHEECPLYRWTKWTKYIKDIHNTNPYTQIKTFPVLHI